MKDEDLKNALKQCEAEILTQMLAEGIETWENLVKYCSYLTNSDEKSIKSVALIKRRKYLYKSINDMVPIGGKVWLWLNSDQIKEGFLNKLDAEGIELNVLHRKFFTKYNQLQYFKFDEIEDFAISREENKF